MSMKTYACAAVLSIAALVGGCSKKQEPAQSTAPTTPAPTYWRMSETDEKDQLGNLTAKIWTFESHNGRRAYRIMPTAVGGLRNAVFGIEYERNSNGQPADIADRMSEVCLEADTDGNFVVDDAEAGAYADNVRVMQTRMRGFLPR